MPAWSEVPVDQAGAAVGAHRPSAPYVADFSVNDEQRRLSRLVAGGEQDAVALGHLADLGGDGGERLAVVEPDRRATAPRWPRDLLQAGVRRAGPSSVGAASTAIARSISTSRMSWRTFSTSRAASASQCVRPLVSTSCSTSSLKSSTPRARAPATGRTRDLPLTSDRAPWLWSVVPARIGRHLVPA